MIEVDSYSPYSCVKFQLTYIGSLGYPLLPLQ